MYLIGYDIGSSSVKASLVDAQSGRVVASDFSPKTEMPIMAHRPGWAEQDPDMWWKNLVAAHCSVIAASGVDAKEIKAIGISYQMHGLVLVDRGQKVLRPSIIWCDSRAVAYGKQAFEGIGEETALSSLLNSPGNFTAAKLAWVKDNEPSLYEQVDKFMLPGDYIAMRLTGDVATTVEGLSEGILWDFRKGAIAGPVMDWFGFNHNLIPEIKPVFGVQGEVSAEAAVLLGLRKGTPVTYRAGDQPNNALSLNVLNPGEIASTTGTSGVVYGVSGKVAYDPLSRVNTLAHVNYTPENIRLGVLLCINGTGILNSWLKKNVVREGATYGDMNLAAARSPVAAKGLSIIPFGNGAERMLGNQNPGCSMHGVNFNIHDRNDILRAAQEGIAYSFRYGMDIMRDIGIDPTVIRAGHSNMFLSPLFREALATIAGAVIELYDTDGAAGAARGAGIGAGIYRSEKEAFGSLRRIAVIEPSEELRAAYENGYEKWKTYL